jgi:hypothetical protein
MGASEMKASDRRMRAVYGRAYGYDAPGAITHTAATADGTDTEAAVAVNARLVAARSLLTEKQCLVYVSYESDKYGTVIRVQAYSLVRN